MDEAGLEIEDVRITTLAYAEEIAAAMLQKQQAVAIIAAVVMKYVRLLDLPLVHSIVLAIVMHVAGVYGDLFESQWKRASEVKDSGKIIPGHGGMLDRFDSAIFAVPAGAIYLSLLNLL